MSWSPDSRWLCYTVCHETDAALELDRAGSLAADRSLTLRRDGGSPRTIRTRPSSIGSGQPINWPQSTVLIEESRWPLSAPAWGPRGKSVAFGRFVPRSGESAGISQPGRLEIVVQKGLDEKTVVWTSPEFVLDAGKPGCISVPSLCVEPRRNLSGRSAPWTRAFGRRDQNGHQETGAHPGPRCSSYVVAGWVDVRLHSPRDRCQQPRRSFIAAARYSASRVTCWRPGR